jgi:hypothetical protein
MSNNTPLSVNSWIPKAIKISTTPNPGGGGIKKFKLTSEQSNNALVIQTPLMHTWGIQEFIDKKTNVGDGKFKLSLNFPMEPTPETDMFKEKLTVFTDTIINLVVENSAMFFSKKKSHEVVSDILYPILKHSKIKESTDIDYTKPPFISIKVDNNYDNINKEYTNQLKVLVCDKNSKKLYPSDDPDDVPMNYVSKSSNVIAIIKCNNIWTGPSNWGISFTVTQIMVVTPGESLKSNICQIKFDNNDEDDTNNSIISTNYINDTNKKPIVTSTFNIPEKSETFINDDDDDDDDNKNVKSENIVKSVVDSDDDSDEEVEKQSVPEPVKPTPEAPKRVVKKIIKKT